MTGVLLGEGQARTATPSPVMTSIQANKLNLPTHSSETVSTEISPVFKSIREQKTKDSVTHKQVADKNPEKKKMGMAILFLGILAEEG